MAEKIKQETAAQIVDTVKAVCSHDINFIDTEGRIYASTNPARIGSYHEIGKKAAISKEPIEVADDQAYLGTMKGINFPILYKDDCIGVIGISGSPDEVRKYGYLAQQITSLLLREQEMDYKYMDRRKQMESFVRTIISPDPVDRRYFDEFVARYQIDSGQEYRCLILELHARFHTVNLPLVERKIYSAFDRTGSSLYSFRYPNEYILLVSQGQWKNHKNVLYGLAAEEPLLFRMGIGASASLLHFRSSFLQARLALRSSMREGNFFLYDDLDLEILLGNIDASTKEAFLKKTIQDMEPEKKDLLRLYFGKNLSLKETSQAMFLHKNTVQYQLNAIFQKTGYNPRDFQDAVILYLALLLEEK